jgi:hypothetical protein
MSCGMSVPSALVQALQDVLSLRLFHGILAAPLEPEDHGPFDR